MASVMTEAEPQQPRGPNPGYHGRQLRGLRRDHASSRTDNLHGTDQGRRGGQVCTRAHAEEAAETCAKLLALKLELCERLERQQHRNNHLLVTLQEKAKESGLLESLAKGKADAVNNNTPRQRAACPAPPRSPTPSQHASTRQHQLPACAPPAPRPLATRVTRHSVDGCLRANTPTPGNGGFTHVFGEPLGSSTSAPVNELPPPAMLEPIRAPPAKADSTMDDSDLPLLRWLLDSSSPLSPPCQAPPPRALGACSDVSHILVKNDAESIGDGAPSADIFPDFFDPLENFTTEVEPLYGRQVSALSGDQANNNQHSTLGPLLCFSKCPPLASAPLADNTGLNAPTGLDPARSKSLDEAMVQLQNMLKDSDCSDAEPTQESLNLDDCFGGGRPRQQHRAKVYRASMSQIPDHATATCERRFSSGQLSLGSRSPARGRMALGPSNGQRWPPHRLTARRQSTPALLLSDGAGGGANPEAPRVTFRRSMQFPLAPSPQPALKRRVSSRGDFSTDDQQPPSRRVSSRGIPGDDLTPLALASPDSQQPQQQQRRFSSCGSPEKGAEGPPVHVVYNSWSEVGEFIFSDRATANSTFEAADEVSQKSRERERHARGGAGRHGPAPSSSTSMTTAFCAPPPPHEAALLVHSLDSNILDSYVSGTSGGGGSQAPSHTYSDNPTVQTRPQRMFYSHSEGMSADDDGVAIFDSFDSAIPTHGMPKQPEGRAHTPALDYDCLMTFGS